MKKLITLLSVLLFTAVMVAEVSPNQKDALTDLYIATNGDKWINTWDLDAPVATWHGVTVENNMVIAINLLFNNLNGTIPSSLSELRSLEKLELSFNKLSGTIPTSIGTLINLEVFAVNGNNITGEIPSSLGQLTALEQLHLSSNNLQGTIPVSVAQLGNLEILNVFDNMLTGTIPYALSDNANLKKLVIAENELTGSEAFASVLAFEQESDDNRFKNPILGAPAKTIIATEVNDDNN